MPARYLNIEEKRRPFIANISSMAHFAVSDGDEVDAEIIIRDPALSLYCLDDATRQAIFVELPADLDLAQVPFIYQTQYEHARRLIAMPYETFHRVTRLLPDIHNLILVYITGRSGSTLLSHVLNAVGNVRSLSEPDVTTQFVHLRPLDGSRDQELRELFTATVRALCKPTPFKTADTFALKFRSEVTELMDLFQSAFPQAHNLFLYRDALGFAASFYRIFQKAGFSETLSVSDFFAGYGAQFHRDVSGVVAYLDPGTEELSLAQALGLWWLLTMETYLPQVARGIPVLAVRYDDLNAHREQVLKSIFAYCGLPTEQITQTLSVFERDAQAGTVLAREKPTEGNAFRLTDEQIAEISTILARHPIVNVSDFIAPGTLTL